MKDTIKYIGLIISIIILFEWGSTIFPFMNDNEYFVDKYGNIHGYNCPYKGVPWFTRKHSKYDILIEKNQQICRECLLHEEDKIWDLHYTNLELRAKNYEEMEQQKNI